MTTRSAVHATFHLERVYDASPERVFKAFADPASKQTWFGGPSEWVDRERSFDFRVGGRETNVATPPGGEAHSFHAIYQDIVPNERIVYTYDMHIGSRRISVSLATVEIRPEGSGARLVITEQGVFLDGYEDAGSREEGTAWLLGKLGDSLSD